MRDLTPVPPVPHDRRCDAVGVRPAPESSRPSQNASMRPVSSIALSGMNAAQSSLGSSAHNIANLGTQAFRREEVQQRTATAGGVSTTVTRAALPGNDPLRDVLLQLSASNAFLANLAVFRASNEMASTLLNLRA